MLSRYRYLISGKPPCPVAISNVEQHSWLGYYAASVPGPRHKSDTGSGEIEEVSEETIELRVSRTVGLGVHEDIDFTNFTQRKCSFLFEIEVKADFADQAETRRWRQKGILKIRWRNINCKRSELKFEYQTRHRYAHQGNRGIASLQRAISIVVENADSKPIYKNGKLKFSLKLEPQSSWHACLKFTPIFENGKMPPLYRCREFFGSRNKLDRRRNLFLNDSTQFEFGGKENLQSASVSATLKQAKLDLAALRLPDLDRNERDWVMAAGLPIYIALFGRDTLTAGWQASMISATPMRGVLYELPKWQGKVQNDWRDEQPGRMLHEAHTGPLSMLNYNPRSRYYGAATTSSFYPVVLSELWHWTGDKALLRDLIEPARAGLAWKDKYSDRFGDGFYDYKSRSVQGNKNQGWKDSGDAIVYEDGSQVDPPISTCEEQAFVYVAKLRMAEMLWVLNKKKRSQANVS